MPNNKDTPRSGDADREIAALLKRVIRVRKRGGQRVVENRARLVKINPVLPLVGSRLFGVPLENQALSLLRQVWPAEHCGSPARTAVPVTGADLVRCIRLFARPSSVRDVLDACPMPRSNRSPGGLDAPQELWMVLKPVLEPVVLRLEADENPSRLAMPRDQDLLIRSQLEVP